MSTEPTTTPENQTSSRATAVLKWFASNVAGALVIAFILYVVGLLASIRPATIIHALGGVTQEDLASYVRYSDTLKIQVQGGPLNGQKVHADNSRQVMIWDDARVEQQQRFSLERWK